jgi:hypothetical protein
MDPQKALSAIGDVRSVPRRLVRVDFEAKVGVALLEHFGNGAICAQRGDRGKWRSHSPNNFVTHIRATQSRLSTAGMCQDIDLKSKPNSAGC